MRRGDLPEAVPCDQPYLQQPSGHLKDQSLQGLCLSSYLEWMVQQVASLEKFHVNHVGAVLCDSRPVLSLPTLSLHFEEPWRPGQPWR